MNTIKQFLYYVGTAAILFYQSILSCFAISADKKRLSFSQLVMQIYEIGILALPIVILLNSAVGLMLTMQGISTLEVFGAEQYVIFGVVVSILREFAPLISSILIAGRTGSAITAKIGSMKISREIDALQTMGIDPVRYLVAPSVLAIVIVIPLIAWIGSVAALLSSSLLVTSKLSISYQSYFEQVMIAATFGDLFHGLIKSVIFGILIVMTGFVFGQKVSGGSESLGRETTNAVVVSISLIIVSDMIAVFISTI